MSVGRHLFLAMALSGLGGVASTSAPSAAHAQVARGEPRDRAALEQEFRRRVGIALKRQLSLTDAQAARLRTSNDKFERQRIAIGQRERTARLAIRDESVRGDSADQMRVGAMLDTLVRVQRERVDVFAAEQRELSEFLSPVQRARYAEMQNQMRRRLDEIRGGGRGRAGPPPGGLRRRGMEPPPGRGRDNPSGKRP